MEGEKSSLRSAVVILIFSDSISTFILLTEGNYIYGVFKDSTIKWNF
jgi:hypothetical protein